MKLFFIIIGVISLILGIIGIIIPLLPTTPFLLLSATLFAHSSPRLCDWLISSPIFGKYIRQYRETKSMPLRAKVLSITLLWASLLYCIFWVAVGMIFLQGLLLIVAIAVTWHILSLGTTPK